MMYRRIGMLLMVSVIIGLLFPTHPTSAAYGETEILRASTLSRDRVLGWRVAIDGDTMVTSGLGVPEPVEEFFGEAYVYERDSNGDWTETAILRPSNPDHSDYFGFNISISGDIIVVGAFAEDGPDNTLIEAGAVYVFERDSNSDWKETTILRAFDAQSGDLFGYYVFLYESMLAVYAPKNNNHPDIPTQVYIYERSTNDMWVLTQVLQSSQPEADDRFGYSMATDGETFLISSYAESGFDNSLEKSGVVYVYERDTNDLWQQKTILRASNADAGDEFGHGLAVAGSRIVTNSYLEDGPDNTLKDTGSLYVFERDDNGVWQETALLYAPDYEKGNSFIWTLTLSGNTFFAGGLWENGLTDPLDFQDVVYMYVLDENNIWQHAQTLYGSNSEIGDEFGRSIAASADTLVVGAAREDGPDNSTPWSGAVYIFDKYNQSPIADAGDDLTLFSTRVVMLAGSGFDPDIEHVTYTWSQTSGPQVTLSNNTLATPTFTAPAPPSTLTFELIVTDPQGAQAVDTVTITFKQPFTQVSLPIVHK